MFANCYSLKTLDISNMNTKNVLDMSGMFQNCNSLTSLDYQNYPPIKLQICHIYLCLILI